MDTENKTFGALHVEPGVIIAKRYEVCERLGAGGVGMVYRAIDRELDGEVVALKLLLPHLSQDETVFRRFRNEVLVARTLSHPNIVRTHDMGRAEGGYSYISMEYVDGVSLKDKLLLRDDQGNFRPSLTFDEALRFLYQIISGVSYAHEKGVIHRDLKPANVLISKKGEVKLADFGTARIMGMDTTLTQTGQVIGTPDYMSPEQIRGELLDQSCDIYALGIMAYELVNGTRPFMADSSVAVAFKHLNDPIPPFASTERGIPIWFEDVVKRASAKKKEDRFSSVMEFAATLLDYAPKLSVQSTFFTVDRTLFRGALGSGAHPVSETQNGAPEKEKSDSVPRKGEGKSELRFELGHSTSAHDEDEGWKFGTAAAEGADTHSRLKTHKKTESHARRVALFGLGCLCGLLAMVMIYSRVSPSFQASWSRHLVHLRDDQPGLAGLLAGLLGIELPADTKPDLTAQSGLPAEDKKENKKEALGTTDRDVKPAEPKATPLTVAAVEKPTATPVVREPDKQETPTKTVEPENSKTAKEEKKDEKIVKEEKPAEALPVFSGSLSFRDVARGPVDDSVAVDKLSQLRWFASLNVSSGSMPAQDVLRNDFAVNIFDLKRSSVVTKLKTDQVQPAGREDPNLRISGSFSALKSLNPSAGAFRVDLVHNGEVLASKDLVLYKASVSLSTPSEPTAPDSRIAIIRGSTITGNEAPKSVPEALPVPTEAPPVTTQPNVPPVTEPPIVINPTQPNLPTNFGSGLPMAKGMNPEDYGAKVPDTSQPRLPPEPVAVPTVQESYGGFLRIPGAQGGREDRLTLILNLEFRNADISGSANIAGYDPFVVSGHVLARGTEMELKNGTYWIRLTSGPQGRSLRGLFSFPAIQKKGGWEATRTN